MDSRIPASPPTTIETTVVEEHNTKNRLFFTGLGCFLGGFMVSPTPPSILGAVLGGYIGSKIGDSIDASYSKKIVTTTTQNLPSCSQENSYNPKKL
jgi:uncharacterized protein YcfJ